MHSRRRTACFRLACWSYPFLLLLLLFGAVVEASPYPRPFPPTVRRLPRRNDFVAYNLHRIIRPRDVNDLGVDQARKAMHDVHETIAEVQRLLALDPSLPRLTRGEIEELFENVTREEFTKSLRAGDHNRAQHMRALMLVLPYHAHNMSPENLQQIYTRPPVTRIVGVAGDAGTSQPPIGAPLPPARLTATTTPEPPPPEATTRARSTTLAVPVTTIRFTTPRPTTFHPTLPERMRTGGLRQEEVNDILASIGLSQSAEVGASPPTFRPMPTTTTSTTEVPTTPYHTVNGPLSNAINADDPKVAQELKELLRSFGLLKEDDPSGSSIGLAPLPGVESLADIQPAALVLHEPLKVEETPPTVEEPAVAALTPKPPVPSTGLTQASVKADDYIAFKPLPTGGEGEKPLDGELDLLLKSFGLLGAGPRNKKSMQREAPAEHRPRTEMKSMPAINPDLGAPQLMAVLGTLGIPMHNSHGASPAPVFRRREKSGRKLDPPGDDVHAARLRVSNEDYQKLEQLWQTVKQLEKLNANLTDDSLAALNPKHYNLSPSLLAQGPDPIDGIDASERLNEIKKRQQPAGDGSATDDSSTPTSDSPTRFSLVLNTTGTASETSSSVVVENPQLEDGEATPTTTEQQGDSALTPASTSTTTATTTTTESARSSALHDSFPSSDLDPVDEEPLPPPRRTGFYYLYDWNSFLEVGEEPNKVIIRYNPRAGDPSRFLPVNVP